MALVVSHGISHGRRGGVAVAAGILLADLVMTALVVAGVATIVAAWPPSFDVLRYAGAFYLAWLAFQAVRRRSAADSTQTNLLGTWGIVRLSTVTSLLNPKALLFFLVLLPQFVDRGVGSLSLQLAVLGTLLSVMAFAFHALLGVFSARASRWLQRNGESLRGLHLLRAGVFLGIAVRLVFLERAPVR
jgi:threonine/homoserine/homoserine lactone efflux protein